MTAADLVRYATDALFVVVFIAALAAALRERRRPVVDAALRFGVLALVVTQGEVGGLLGVTLPPAASDLKRRVHARPLRHVPPARTGARSAGMTTALAVTGPALR